MVTNPKVVFIIVGALALMAFTSLIFTFILILLKADAVLIAIVAGQFGQTALTALITLLTNTRTQAAPPPAEPLPVKAMNTAADPVPTMPQPPPIPSTPVPPPPIPSALNPAMPSAMPETFVPPIGPVLEHPGA